MGTASETLEPDDERRAQHCHRLKVVANCILGAAVGATAVSLFQPNGYAPTIAFASFVLYLLLCWIRSQT